MAYQNVGRPRFFIDNYIYLRALGLEPESYINKTEEQNDFSMREFITVLNNENAFTLSPERSIKFESLTNEGEPRNNIRFFIGSLTLVVLLVVLTCVAKAQQQLPCSPTKETMEKLQQQHKEALVFRGISVRGHITIIHLNKDSGTWTA